jgi:hypothetical protein
MVSMLQKDAAAASTFRHRLEAGSKPVALDLTLGVQALLVVFAVSNGLFLARAVASPWVALGGMLALAGGLAVLFARRPRPVSGETHWAIGLCLLALTVSVLGGAGHFLFAAEDWTVRDAVLGDLRQGPWPKLYDWDGRSWFLRAPLGFYEIPAAIGAVLGLKAAHLAVLAQNTVVVAAVLAVFAREAEGRWRRFTLLAVFLLFSGMDIVGMTKAWALATADGQVFPFPLHIERWAGDLEYSSTLTGLFWAPNHSLPAWAFVAVFLCWRRQECSAPALAAFSALTFFWSPLSAVGMAPFVLFALARDFSEGRLKLPHLAAAAVVGIAVLPAAIFLQLGSGAVEQGWLLAKPGYPLRYVVFCLHEALPAIYLMWRSGHGDHRFSRPELAIVSAVLLLLPLYMIGASNDFMMRASTVSLTLAALVIGERLIACIDQRRFKPAAAILAVLGIGAVTPLLEITRAVALPAQPANTQNLPQAWAGSAFSWAPPDTYRAPVDALDTWSWLFKRPPGAPSSSESPA